MKRIKLLSLFLVISVILTCMPIMPQTKAAGDFDLTITSVAANTTSIYDEDKILITATIRNIGSSATTGTNEIEFYIDGKLIQTVKNYDTVSSGGRINVSTTIKKMVTFGSHRIAAIIKEDTIYKESDYSNNILKQRITVSTDLNPNPVFDAEEGIIINQVYGGGGKGDTPFDYSFIELYNTTNKSLSLDGYKLNYSSNRSASDGDGGTGGRVYTFNLSGTIPSHTSYLVRCTAEKTTVAAYNIATYDASWGRVIDNKQYCVTLTKNNSVADAVSAVSDKTLEETIGEAMHIVGISKQTAVRRKYFADTNNNFEDFEIINSKGATNVPSFPRSLKDGEWENVKPSETGRVDLPPSTEKVTPYATTVLEAEDQKILGAATIGNTYTGYHGKGYVKVPPSVDNGISFTINAAEASLYTFVIHAGNADLDYSVDYDFWVGEKYYTHGIAHQKQWSSWKACEITHYLNKGVNNIKIVPHAAAEIDFTLDYIEYYKENTEIESFSFTKKDNPFLPGDIPFSIDGANITAFVPADLNLKNIIPQFKLSGCDRVTVGGKNQTSGVTANNYESGQYYRCYSGSTLVRTYAVTVKRVQNTTLPNLYINLPGATFMEEYTLKHGSSTDKDIDVKFSATLQLNKNNNVLNGSGYYGTFTDQTGLIHLRGNSTAGQAKKGYKLKFDTKQQVLDMDNSKHWVLVANYDDKTLMRQYVGYELANYLYGDTYTPVMKYVNMYLGGEYMGVYLLGQNIRVAGERVDIEEITAESTDITGGYIIEFDQRQDVDYHYRFSVTVDRTYYPFSIVAPDEDVITEDHVAYIKQYTSDFLNTLTSNPSSGNYEKYIDVDSFVNWYVAMEIMKTSDAQMYASIYMYKDANGKFHMGPCWDFNPGAGNINYNGSVVNSSGFWIRNGLWWRYLFRDQDFVDKVKARYKELRTNYDIVELIDQLTLYLDIPQEDNFARWPCLSTYCWPEPKILYEYDAYVAYFRQWMTERLEWLDKQYGV